MTDGPTKEELEAIQRDIEAAKNSLVVDATKKVAEEAAAKARSEAQREFELQKAVEEQARLAKEAQEALARQKAETEAQLNALKAKMDSLISSKAPARIEDPFASNPKAAVDTLSESQAAAVVERAQEEFFGPDLWRTIKQNAGRN